VVGYRYGHVSTLHVYLIRSRIKTTYINHVQYAAPSHACPFEFVEAFLGASLTSITELHSSNCSSSTPRFKLAGRLLCSCSSTSWEEDLVVVDTVWGSWLENLVVTP
jgi:hypothetical protein